MVVWVEPDAAETRDFSVFEEPEGHRVDAHAVAAVGSVVQGIVADNTLATWIEGGYP